MRLEAETAIINTINDRLSVLGSNLKTKPFGRALCQTGCLIGPGQLLKK